MTKRQNLGLALQAAEDGALVLTSNTRSARFLKREFSERQADAKRDVWSTPDILPWSAWLRRLWRGSIYGNPQASAALLDDVQERLVWEQIIAAENRSVDAMSLAGQCVRAWRLLHAYRLPRERALFQQKKDTAAFFRWAGLYSARCNKAGWMDEARLPDALHAAAARECSRRKLIVWGFDDLTPQQEDFFAHLKTASVTCERLEPEEQPAVPRRLQLEDTHKELRSAAQWARAALERDANAKIGIVIPNLHEITGTVERILLEVLHPDATIIEGSDRRRAFHISFGTALSSAPVINAAFQLLKLAAGTISLEEASRLLRSPFLGDEGEFGERCLLDADIRAKGLTELSLIGLDEWASSKSGTRRFSDSMRAFREAVAKLPRRQTASRWSREMLELLRAGGWPGSRTETSTEHQARRAFVDLLAKFAGFDLVHEPMDFATMLRRLTALADETLFQIENLGAPIQVVGVLEAAGSHFDGMWVTGLHADSWPPAPVPSPFLPLPFQREALVPGGSSEERLRYATQVTNRLLRSAPEVIFSWPAKQGDQQLTVSALIESFEETVPAALGIENFEAAPQLLFGSGAESTVVDEAGPELTEAVTKGGTKIFQLQAQCPFRAFTQIRLRAEELQMPQPGIDHRLRGTLLHDAVQLVWSELRAQKRLLAKSQVEREELVRRCVDMAVGRSDAAAYDGWEREVTKIERARLVQLILGLLALEATRSPFTVLTEESERKRDVLIGDIALTIRADRVDLLEDGRRILLDYKSGEPKISSWDGDRPDDPQLPIYATQLKQDLAAVSFIQMKNRDEICFKGYAKNDGDIPDVKAFDALSESKRPAPTWDEMISYWEKTLQRLACAYREGHAVVDPKKPDTCNYCHLDMICRIAEMPPAPDEEAADE